MIAKKTSAMFMKMRASILCLVLWVCPSAENKPSSLTITKKFINGDVLFEWTGASSDLYYVRIRKDEKHEPQRDWFQQNHTQYTIKDVLLYDIVGISTAVPGEDSKSLQFNVSKVKAKEGDTVNIFWFITFFPQSGYNEIYHINNNENKRIITIDSKEGSNHGPKYRYLSEPITSTNILVEIKNITIDDAGYYVSGAKLDDALSGVGVVLIVLGKPEITGKLDILVGSHTNLTCSIKSAPDYYTKLKRLSYKWFVNDTLSSHEENLKMLVDRDDKYNNYSCIAEEKGISSNKSDPVKINPLYKPEKIFIYPPKNALTVKEGQTIGPYNCSADCNPPCEISWKYKGTDRHFYEANSKGPLLENQSINRTFSLFSCQANYIHNSTKEINLILNVTYLDEPMPFINGDTELRRQLDENIPINLSCYVNGNPMPRISLIRNTEATAMLEKHANLLTHIINSSQCSDTATYKCIGSSTGFNKSEKSFAINVTCKPRIDKSVKIKTTYGSMSGPDVRVPLVVPVIANPPPQESKITWSIPSTNHIIKSTISQHGVPYKHWINSSIPILNQKDFGQYTLKYDGYDLITLTIKAEDVPEVPVNFTAYSFDTGYINITWVSGFNGGKEQHFILSKREGHEWKDVKNISDPGQGNIVYYTPASLTAGQEYWYGLKSCNVINCTKTLETTFTVKEKLSQSPLLNKNFVIGASAGVIILILTIGFVLFVRMRKRADKRQENVQVEVEDDDQPDVVLYAAVDKSALKSNQNKADVVEDIPEKTDGNQTLYATVEKASKTEAKPSAVKKVDKEKKDVKKKKQELVTLEESVGATSASRNVNQDGLIYIDVEFAKKSDNTDTNTKPKIHGEEDRTEYTFVDFSKKAPVVKENQKKEEEK